MRIAFIVNDVRTEQGGYTTSRLGAAAINLGHEAWVIGAGDLAYDPHDAVSARAKMAPKSKYKNSQTYLKDLQGPSARTERISVDDISGRARSDSPSSSAEENGA